MIEMFSRGLFEYWLDLTNLLEWACYVLSVIFVLDFGSSGGLGVKEPWQWECGAVAVWLAWMVLLLFIQKVPIFGIYILMFVTVIKTFFRFLFVFGLFIAAFSFSFYMLLQNQEKVWQVAKINVSGSGFTRKIVLGYFFQKLPHRYQKRKFYP